jgi:hypothetical protein
MIAAEQIRALVAKMTPEEKAEVDRLMAGAAPNFCDPAFPEQSAFIRDKSRQKVGFGTRRCGKSLGAVGWLLDGAFESTGCDVLLIGLVRSSVKRAMWKPGVKLLDKKHRLGGKFNETDLTYTLPNGSTLYLLGMDKDADQLEKLLGGKIKRVVIDEAGSYRIDLRELIFTKLTPALSDLRGEIAIIGTPTNLKSGLFYELTKEFDACNPGHWKRDGWSCHRWSAFQNPYMVEQWNEDIARFKADTSNIEDVPWFIQQYLGRWVVDTSKLVYKYMPVRNDFDVLPDFQKKGRWHYVLGIDLGYEDDSAFVVAAYHDFDRTLYFLEGYAEPKLDITDVANKAKGYKLRYDLDAMIVDGANKQAVEEMRRRHDLPLTAADKTGKADFIELMNAEFIKGLIKVQPDECAGMIEEYSGLIWDERSAKKEEHPACPNHWADAGLYSWRHCYQYLSEMPETPPAPGTPEAIAREVAKMRQEAEDELREMKEMQEEVEGVGFADDWDVI